MKDEKYIQKIKDSLNDIEKLIETPKFIKTFVLESLEKFDEEIDLKNTGKNKIKNIAKSIKNIEDGTLKSNFQIIYNQTCVLAVSALATTLEEYFVNYVQSNWNKISKEKNIKIPLSDLIKYNLELKTLIGKIILEKDTAIKLEDLKSLIRTFKDYFNIEIKIEEKIKKNIIFYQQCRHIIVHKNGIVDEEFLKKVSENKCNIKNYGLKDKIILGNSDWLNIKIYFLKLIEEFTDVFKKK